MGVEDQDVEWITRYQETISRHVHRRDHQPGDATRAISVDAERQLEIAGVELSERRRRTIAWLANSEPETFGAVMSMITRTSPLGIDDVASAS